MEALLIEATEPRQKRKRGDDFQAVEFLQVEDPEIEKRRKRELLDQLATDISYQSRRLRPPARGR